MPVRSVVDPGDDLTGTSDDFNVLPVLEVGRTLDGHLLIRGHDQFEAQLLDGQSQVSRRNALGVQRIALDRSSEKSE